MTPTRSPRTPRTQPRPHASTRHTAPQATVAAPVKIVSPSPEVRLPRRWHDTVLPAELPQMARDINLRVRAEIAEYRWPADGEQMRRIREGTEKALLSFVTQVFRTGRLTDETEDFFRGLGRLEAVAGRHLESLHAAFRIGALVAWRRIAAAAERDPLPSETVARLADLIFTFADRLAQLAAEGFAQAHAEEVDGYARLRARLVRMIVGQPALSSESIAELAVRAAWPVPDRVAVIELDGRADPQALAGLGADALIDAEQPDTLVVLPAPVDLAEVRAGLAGLTGRAVVGCTVPLPDAAKSLRWARLGRRLAEDGVLPAAAVLSCDEHVPTLLLHAEPELAEVLVARRLAPFAAMPLVRRLKFARLLATWLEHGGSQADLAATLQAHRQTVHYRVGRLQAMFGNQLADPSARVEMLLALRWALPQWEREAS